ncbi:MAG: sugar phosphate isomerase/epimerase family protein [Planctomycetota bacterium]
MPRLSMNELTTFRWSFDEDLLHYQRAGYDAIGVWRRKLTDFGEERAVELLTESGLAVSNLLWAGGFTGNDGRTQAESLADARAAIRTAAVIDAGCLVLYTGGRNNHTQRHADRLVRHALDTLLAEADAAGVTLAIEPMHAACGGEWSVLSSLEETCTLLADYAHPRLKMVYDTYHFPACDGVAAMLGELAPLIAVVHLGDTATPHSIDQERCPLGEGGTPVREAIAGLIAAGYEGDFDVELMGSATEGVAYPELLSRSRCLFREALSAAGAVPR